MEKRSPNTTVLGRDRGPQVKWGVQAGSGSPAAAMPTLLKRPFFRQQAMSLGGRSSSIFITYSEDPPNAHRYSDPGIVPAFCHM